jgi:plasmid stabilization system protein ParE
MRLRWTSPAANDLYNIVQHIEKDNPNAASDVAKILYDGCEGLSRFPRQGRKGRTDGTANSFSPGCRTLLCIGSKIR